MQLFFVKPVEKITKTIESISLGKVDVTVEGTEREDEIGSLAKAFDRTIVSLRLAMKKIKGKKNE